MSKLYTFPTYKMPSGDLTIQLITSTGSGTQSVTEKYFTKISPLRLESELGGGAIRANTISFEIENDVVDLFRSTIFPVAQNVSNSYVDVVVTFNGGVTFLGIIDPYSLHDAAWYAANPDLAGSNNSCSFQTKDIFGKLQYVSVAQWAATLAAQAVTVGAWKLISIRSLFMTLINMLASQFGYTVAIQYLVDFQITSAAFNGGWYAFPGNANADEQNALYDQEPYCTYRLNTGSLSQLFLGTDPIPIVSFFQKANASDILIQMLKDFGVILTIEYTSSTIFLVKVKNRDDSSAAQIVSGTVLKSERTLVAEEFVDAINITSVDSRESYKKQIFATKINEFSHTGDFVVQFFGTGLERSFDALQGNELVGYRYDYSFPLGSYIFYWGSSLITPIWTVGAGVSSRSTVWGTIYEFDLSSSATRSMSQDFALTNENLMFKCLLGFEGTANAGSTFVLTMTLKDSTGAAVTTFTMPLTYAQLNLLSSSSSIIGAGFKLSVLFGVPVNEAIFLKTITVQIQAIGITSGNLRMAMVNWGVYRNEESVARFLGRKIYNLFTKIRSKYIRSFSGISIGNVGDYFDAEGLRYYAKLIEKDYYNDETNIEAINYQ